MPGPNYTKSQVIRALRRKLTLHFRPGKEQNGWYVLDGKFILRATVPKGRGALPSGTSESIRNQVKLSRSEFAELIRCPLSGKDYEQIIRDKTAKGLL